jgi:hypothetical protein
MRRGIWLGVTACVASAAFATLGGACLPSASSAPPPPFLKNGQYVLTSSGASLPPQIVVTTADGHRVRVVADTILFNTASQQYLERGSVAITPAGGTEQAPTPIALGTQTYTMTSNTTFDLPVTVAGVAHGTILTAGTIDLRMPDGSHWRLALR